MPKDLQERTTFATAWRDYRVDRRHYPRSAWVTHRALWAVAAYRFARAADGAPPPIKLVAKPLSIAITLFVRCTTNIELPTTAIIGPGLHIRHAGPIVVNGNTRIGRDCLLITGVVLGSRIANEAPVIGDNVRFSVFSAVLGDVQVGDGAVVGAHTLVLSDVPAGASVVGIPGRVVGPGVCSG